MQKQNINNQREIAASITKSAYQFINEQLDSVESGNSLKCRIDIFPESRFPYWATALAKLLCNDPELADLSNKKLAEMIENEDGETGLDHTILSKKLSAIQRDLVGAILRKHGYATDTLFRGTDIKRIVKNNIRTETEKDDGVVFFADGVSIDGTMYKYRQRQVTPTSTPWTDFSVRMAGHETPLHVVLTLRKIGINEFLRRDEAARKFASTEQTVKRQQLDRQPKKSRAITKLIAAVKANSGAFDDPADSNGIPAIHVMLNALKSAPKNERTTRKTKTEPGASYISNPDGTLTKITTLDTNLPRNNLSASEPAIEVPGPCAH